MAGLLTVKGSTEGPQDVVSLHGARSSLGNHLHL